MKMAEVYVLRLERDSYLRRIDEMKAKLIRLNSYQLTPEGEAEKALLEEGVVRLELKWRQYFGEAIRREEGRWNRRKGQVLQLCPRGD